MQDKVSIITPSWNSEKYIEKTIESVQKQTYMNWEMIVVDDCSTDRTVEIVEKISEEDPRVRIIRQEVNGGAAKARNRSLCEATGRYIAYLDADDIWKPTKLEKQVEFMPNKISDALERMQLSDFYFSTVNSESVDWTMLLNKIDECLSMEMSSTIKNRISCGLDKERRCILRVK